MRVIRTLVWVVITAVVVAFIAMNWGRPAVVRFWPLDGDFWIVEWPVGIVALVFFLLGLVPMWLLHKAATWRLNRRISSLENAVRAATPTPPIATSTQLEAASAEPAPAPSNDTPEDKPA